MDKNPSQKGLLISPFNNQGQQLMTGVAQSLESQKFMKLQ